MIKNNKNRKKNSLIVTRLFNQEMMISAYTGGRASPISPSFPQNLYRRSRKIEIPTSETKSFETVSRLQNDYSPILPAINSTSSKIRVNFLKQNMSISNQIIRSYRSFSRRHAYNIKYDVTEPNEDQLGASPYNLQKDTVSTNAASSPKAKREMRIKSSFSRTSKSVIPERVIQVKPIDGKEMLDSILETKETEKKLAFMKNRVEKLLKEK